MRMEMIGLDGGSRKNRFGRFLKFERFGMFKRFNKFNEFKRFGTFCLPMLVISPIIKGNEV